jgi:hypothetical protein
VEKLLQRGWDYAGSHLEVVGCCDGWDSQQMPRHVGSVDSEEGHIGSIWGFGELDRRWSKWGKAGDGLT